MAFANLSFETAGATPGAAASWSIQQHGQYQYADFGVATKRPWETFESEWLNDSFKFSFTGIGTDLLQASWQTELPTPKLFENFEEHWTSNHTFVFGISGIAAQFDTVPQNFEDFEENWMAFYLFSLAGTVTAQFDVTPEGFEDFEEDWVADYLFALSGTAAAQFDTTPENFEDFEEDFPTLVMSTI